MILTAEQTEAFKSCEVFSTCKDCAMGIVSGSRMCSMVMAEAYEELLRMVKETANGQSI
jgi:hypothetical protein